MVEQAQLRRIMRAKRRTLSQSEQLQHSNQILKRILAAPWFKQSRRIAVYLAVNGEIDVRPTIRAAWRLKKQLYLPVLSPHPSNRLLFAPYTPKTPLVANRFGISEPKISIHQMLKPIQLDLVLTPLVAFDERGNRLGMGGGFYDRSFAFIRHRNHWQRPKLIGLAHDFQRVETLPMHPWDVPLHSIITEQQHYQPKA